MGIYTKTTNGWEEIGATPASSGPDFSLVNADLGKVYTTKSYDLDISAIGAEAYALESGNLPTGLSLNGETGRIVGTPTGIDDFSVDNEYTFLVRAFSKTGSTAQEFTINANSIYVAYECFSAGGGTMKGTVTSPYVIKRVDFANWGRPNGSCGSYSTGHCGCGLNLNGFIGKPSFSVNLDTYCGDPCPFEAKWAYVQLSIGPADDDARETVREKIKNKRRK